MGVYFLYTCRRQVCIRLHRNTDQRACSVCLEVSTLITVMERASIQTLDTIQLRCHLQLRRALWNTVVNTTSGKGNLQIIKKTPHLLLNFLQISTIFASFSRAHAGTLQNHSISPCTTTVQNNTVESSTIFHSNLMLRINWFYEI